LTVLSDLALDCCSAQPYNTEKPMPTEHITLKRITLNKFEILAGMTRRPTLMFMATEIEHYSDGDENYLGVILIDTTDQDFSAIVLARDEFGKFCCMDLTTSMESIEEARVWLAGAMRWNSGSGKAIHPQGHNSRPTLNLFKAIVPVERQHVYFRRVHSSAAFRGARKAINEMMPHFTDVDGNYVEQFQSHGFDSRLWELYVFAVLKESGVDLDRSHNAPDFIGSRFGSEFALEAVIVGRRPGEEISALAVHPKHPSPLEIEIKLRDEMPIRYGSPLYSKLNKKYWLMDHVKGKPLVFAIADFHDDQSMIWSNSALYAYLYGIRYELISDSDGTQRPVRIDIQNHSHDGKTIPSGFFRQPESEYISAVLTSASGTISKFNRMGRQAGYGDPQIKVMRFGTCHDHDPSALKPKSFSYEVNENGKEIWSEGINVYHNPNAKFPLDPEVFPFAGHHTIKDGDIVSMLPEFHPFASWTMNIIPQGIDNESDGIIIP